LAITVGEIQGQPESQAISASARLVEVIRAETPSIEPASQEFAFDLAEVMGRIEEMRLYIAVISTAPVASDGSWPGD
jgi:hypothetical protein